MRLYEELPTRPWFIAAPRKIAPDVTTPTLTMYTFQDREAYDVLASEGVLVGDPRRGDLDFHKAYGWMMRQMTERLPGHEGGLVWLWQNPTRRWLRGLARRARGDVLLTVRVERQRILLHDYSAWHAVLNRGLLVPREPGEAQAGWDTRWADVSAAFEARSEPFSTRPLSDWPPGLREELEGSWGAIFDSDSWEPEFTLQATANEVKASDVIRAVRIV